MAAAPEPPGPGPTAGAAAAAFSVRFGRFLGLMPDALGLCGPGSLQIAADRLVLSEARDSRRVELPLQAIEDVSQAARRVRFAVEGPAAARVASGIAASQPLRVCVRTAGRSSAAALAAALPERLSPGYAQRIAEQNHFVDTLIAAAPRLYVTPVLIGLNLLMYLLAAVLSGRINPRPGILIGLGSNDGALSALEGWRLLTNTFLHFSLLHIGLNMWALYGAGAIAERLFGRGAFLMLYLCCGVIGSAASLAWNPMVHSAGASGAIFGVLGALGIYIIDRRNGVPLTVMRSQRLMLAAMIGGSIFFGFTQPGIDNAAHLGGLGAGLFAGWLLGRPLGRLGEPRRLALACGQFALLAALSLAAAAPAVLRARSANDIAFREAAARFEQAEPELEARADALLAEAEMPVGERAQGLRRAALQWKTYALGFEKTPLSPRSSLGELRGALIRYASLRADALAAFADGVQDGDAGAAQRGALIWKESDAIARDMQERRARFMRRAPP